ncbi:hypothetical protein FRX31_005857 [Thalictrum thalictroides]|uniref:Uncharacterized protein n=1 Tax=Thalictrum thalictroides TaxID=46969 RepID=A0A7J6X5A9_THATH|nr:hypothetical protein FRX31_005857 [Thalictrum thalictroides]
MHDVIIEIETENIVTRRGNIHSSSSHNGYGRTAGAKGVALEAATDLAATHGADCAAREYHPW